MLVKNLLSSVVSKLDRYLIWSVINDKIFLKDFLCRVYVVIGFKECDTTLPRLTARLCSPRQVCQCKGWWCRGGGGRENDRVMILRRERERYTENCRRMGTGSTLPLIRTKNVIIKSFLMKHLFVGNCTAIDAPPGFACVILTQFWFLKWFIIGWDGAVLVQTHVCLDRFEFPLVLK